MFCVAQSLAQKRGVVKKYIKSLALFLGFNPKSYFAKNFSCKVAYAFVYSEHIMFYNFCVLCIHTIRLESFVPVMIKKK